MPSGSIPPFIAIATLALAALMTSQGSAQTQDSGAVVTSLPCRPGNTMTSPGPACLLAHQDLGALPNEPVYWHIDEFADENEARSASTKNGTVVSDFGKVWLFTVAGKHWRSKGGIHVATVGPLPIAKAAAYSAEFVHSLFSPGMSAPIHKHSGPEAFYALDGDTCLEMPGGSHIGTGPGNHLVMPANDPMLLMAIGKVPRRAFALILHDATLPPTTRVTGWKPAGLCEARLSSGEMIGRQEILRSHARSHDNHPGDSKSSSDSPLHP